MSRKDKKKRHKRLHLITRLVIWGVLFLCVVMSQEVITIWIIAAGLINGLWLFLNELEHFEENVISMVDHYND